MIFSTINEICPRFPTKKVKISIETFFSTYIFLGQKLDLSALYQHIPSSNFSYFSVSMNHTCSWFWNLYFETLIFNFIIIINFHWVILLKIIICVRGRLLNIMIHHTNLWLIIVQSLAIYWHCKIYQLEASIRRWIIIEL